MTLKEQCCSEANRPCSWDSSPIWSSEGFYQSARKMSALQGMKCVHSFLSCFVLCCIRKWEQQSGLCWRMGNSALVASRSYQKFNRLNPDLSSDRAAPELSDTLKLSCTGVEFKNVFWGVTSYSDHVCGTKLIQRREFTYQNNPGCFILCISQQ